MISVVLYGRNDSYGYNLHKRAALSLNCIAELLTGPDDEILFVDYNTPNDFPVFLEAIQDTLTPRARAITRCLRVRPHVHQQFAHRTHLVALESIARNVAVRRSNPSNRWILSTNTDMIFVPHKKGSLTEIAADLPDGFYHAPRMEIPETLWESTDRTKPAEIIDTIRRWGNHLYLNEIVHGSDTILYDGPGDFQLCLRKDMFEIQGFHEDMLLGWHVDSNLAARLSLIHGPVGDLGEEVWGYHCDHTRQITPMHAHNRLENDWVTYGERVKRPDLPQHAESWGCAHEEIEEVRVDGKTVAGYIETLEHSVGKPLARTLTASISRTGEDVAGFEPRHTLPFLIDLFATERRDFQIAWWGLQPQMLSLFAKAWRESGFEKPILCDERLASRLSKVDARLLRFAPLETCIAETDAFLFDMTIALKGRKDDSAAPDAPLRAELVIEPFLAAVAADRARLGTAEPLRRFIAIGAINNRIERLMRSVVGTGQTPYSTRLRHGFVLAPPKGAFPILKEMWLGKAGERYYKTIETITGKSGHVVSGPWRYFEPGIYAARLTVTPKRNLTRTAVLGMFQHYARGERAQGVPLLFKTSGQRVFTIHFEVPSRDTGVLAEIFDFQVLKFGNDDFTVDDLTIEPQAAMPGRAQRLADITDPYADVGDWMTMMHLLGTRRLRDGSVQVKPGQSGYVVGGPYLPLPTGLYAVAMTMSCDPCPPDTLIGLVEITVNTELRLSRPVYARDITAGPITARFAMRQSDDPDALREVEIRVHSSGAAGFVVRSLQAKRIAAGATDCDNWLAGITPTEVSAFVADGLQHRPGEGRYLTKGPYWPLDPGAYEAIVDWSEPASGSAVSIGTLDIVRDGEDLASHPLPIRREHSGPFALPFVVSQPAAGRHDLIEVRIAAAASAPFTVGSVAVRRFGESALDIPNWLSALRLGPAGEKRGEAIAAKPGVEGYLVTGPYYPLEAGRYSLVASIGLPSVPRTRRPLGIIECLIDGKVVGSAPFHLHNALLGRRAVPFVVEAAGRIEMRILSTGVAPFLLKSLRLKRAS